MPVWIKTPDDILPALEWAKAHDEEAMRIAANAQKFALKYLDKRARTCYWFRLLQDYAKLLRYTVSPQHEVQEAESRLRSLLEAEPASWGAGKDLQAEPLHSALLPSDEEMVLDSDAAVGAGRKARRVRSKEDHQDLGGQELGSWQTVEEYLRVVPGMFEKGLYKGSFKEEPFTEVGLP